MNHKIVILLIIFWPVLAVSQAGDRIQPLVQLPGDNLNPDFSESEAFSYFPPGEKWWLAWDTGTSEIRNIYVKSHGLEDNEWSSEIAITSENYRNQNPDIESFGDSVLVVWESNKRGNFDILYSIFDGHIWTEPQFVTRDSADNHNPALHTYKLIGQKAYEALVVWERNHTLYWSKFDGKSWSMPSLFDAENDSARAPNFGREHSLPFLVWEGLKNNNWDIYGSWFVPDSNYWVNPVRLTTEPAEDRSPQVGQADVYYVPVVGSFSGLASIVWQTNRDGNWEVYSGMYWVSDGPPLFNVRNLSSHESSDREPAARLTVRGDVFFVVSAWQSDRTGREKIVTTDILTYPDSALSRHPRYSRSIKLQYWLAWESQRNVHWEIWGNTIQPILDAVERPSADRVPDNFKLAQNYPNPFNMGTVIPLTISKTAYVELEVFNIGGQKIKTLLAEKVPPGSYQVTWDGNNEHGALLQSGVYFIHLRIDHQSMIRKAVILK